jgi:signal transduction histidine kinase
MKPIRLDRVVEDSLAIFSTFMESRRVKVERSVLESEISGDGELLKQVFMNVFINAIQAMPDGGKFEIRMHRDEESVIVDIKDQGCGIKQEDMEKIFDPFFSTKDAGTGLGLAIAAKIMQTHGGYSKVESEVGRGSAFGLYFPQR